MEKFENIATKSKNLLEFFDKLRKTFAVCGGKLLMFEAQQESDIFLKHDLDHATSPLKCLENAPAVFNKMSHGKAIREITDHLIEARKGIKKLFKQAEKKFLNDSTNDFENIKLSATLKFNDVILSAQVINQKSRGRNRIELETKLDHLWLFDNNKEINTPTTYGKSKCNISRFAPEFLLPIN